MGKSLAIISDARISGRADQAQIVERLLTLTGDDAPSVDRKNLTAVERQLGVRLMLLSNELPRLKDSSGALAGRLVLLPMTESWLGQEDRSLERKLLKELPQILRWALSGWASLVEMGHFVSPERSAGILGDMGRMASPVASFVADCCLVGPDLDVLRKDLFEAWKGWSERNNEIAGGSEEFGKALRAFLPDLDDSQPRIEGKRKRIYKGLALLPSTEWGS